MNDLNNLNNTPDSTATFDPADIQENKVMALLSYIWILFLVPMLGKKDSPYAQYHAKQGANLFIIVTAANVILNILTMILGSVPVLGIIIWLVSLVVGIASLAFMIIGCVNAYGGKAKELPVIGGIKIIK